MFTKYFKIDGVPKISLQKIIKKIEKKFSEEEWKYLKTYHKRSRKNSRLSSTKSHISNVSMEEEKQSKGTDSRRLSETSSIASG
jgi:hypothetical protein